MNKQQTNGSTTAWGAAERSDGERSEAERSAAAPHAGAKNRPNPEVRPRAQRRSFTAAYKQKILAEADAATGSGTIGALLRREGLYSSHLTHWRQERDAGITNGLTPRTRGPKRALIFGPKRFVSPRPNERDRTARKAISSRRQKKVAFSSADLAQPDPRTCLMAATARLP